MVRFDECIYHQAQRLVRSVGEEKLVGTNAEMPRHFAANCYLLGVGGNRRSGQSAKRAANGRRAADGIFVEIHAQLICAALERRLIRPHAFDGAPDRKWFHWRTSTERA